MDDTVSPGKGLQAVCQGKKKGKSFIITIMSPELGVLIMLNNYFHDVATALLAASGVTMWIVAKRYERHRNTHTLPYFLELYKGITGLAKFSLYWILIGGVPRTIFYKDFEWANAAGREQVPALIVKHILAFTFVGTGAYLWLKLSKKIKTLLPSEKL